MAIPVGSCEVWFQYLISGDNEPMYTHVAYDLVDSPDQASVDAGFTDWQTIWRGEHPNTVSLVGGHILVGNDGGSVRWDSSIASVVGTGAGTNLPQNTALLARKSTALGGRRGRGRMFIPGVRQQEVSSAGVVSTTYVSAWNVNLAAISVGGTTHTAFGFLGQVQLLHETGSQTPTEVTDLSMQNIVATQRRRLRR